MMRTKAIPALIVTLFACTVSPAQAQRLTFERSFDVAATSSLDVSTIRGRIDITAGDPGRVTIAGSVTVRVGVDVPANAVELAGNVAAHPPVEQDGNTVRLRPPTGNAERRAVTVAYQVRVPSDTKIVAVSDSGATTVRELSGPVTVKTQSGAIELTELGGTAAVTTRSGSVTADGISGTLTVETASSGFTGRSLHANLHARTASGAISAAFVGPGDIDIETGSSGITLTGVNGALRLTTRSGRLTIAGKPRGPWHASTVSGSIGITLDSGASGDLDASSGSGSVRVVGLTVEGEVSKKRATGRIGDGGPLLKLTTRSGSIRVGMR